MRLKEDSSSWRSGAIKKRDFKHDHSELEIKFWSHKNTHRWCRGKVGVQHDLVWRVKKDLFGHKYRSGRCLRCRKIMFSRVKTT